MQIFGAEFDSVSFFVDESFFRQIVASRQKNNQRLFKKLTNPADPAHKSSRARLLSTVEQSALLLHSEDFPFSFGL